MSGAKGLGESLCFKAFVIDTVIYNKSAVSKTPVFGTIKSGIILCHKGPDTVAQFKITNKN